MSSVSPIHPVDPNKRFTIQQCLEHPYLQAYHDPDDEPTAPPLAPGFFDVDLHKESIGKDDLKRMLCVAEPP
jgi:mitogen-activated protein kinase 1/3